MEQTNGRIMEDDKDSATVEKRKVKPTAKVMEDALQRKAQERLSWVS